MKRVLVPVLVACSLLVGCGGGDSEPETNWERERVDLSRSQAAFQVQDDETRERMVDAVIAGRRAADDEQGAAAERRSGEAFGDAYVDDGERRELYYSPLVAAEALAAWMKGAPRTTCLAAGDRILDRFAPEKFVEEPEDPAYDRQRAKAPGALKAACANSPGSGALPEPRGPAL